MKRLLRVMHMSSARSDRRGRATDATQLKLHVPRASHQRTETFTVSSAVSTIKPRPRSSSDTTLGEYIKRQFAFVYFDNRSQIMIFATAVKEVWSINSLCVPNVLDISFFVPRQIHLTVNEYCGVCSSQPQ